MYAHCKKIYLPLLLVILGSMSSLRAVALRWVHLGTVDAGLVSMVIDGKVAYRNMPSGNATPWGNIPPGLRRLQIGSVNNPGTPFELEITQEQKVVIVSVSDKSGDIQSRTVVLDAPEGEGFVLNALHGSMMSLPETEKKVIFGKGFRIPITKIKTTVSFSDSEGLKGELDFSRTGDAPHSSFLAILSSDDDGKPLLSVLRDRDSLFEISDGLIAIPNEMRAAVRVISGRNIPNKGAFDPLQVKWEEVESKIFWLNLTVGRDPCRLEIGGFPAMRRMPSGRGSGFVKWPAGAWETNVVVELTNEKVGASQFSLSSKSGLGLVSSGGGKFPHRLIVLEGRSRGESEAPAKPRIRFMNALPDGVLRSVISSDPEPKTITLKPADVSDVVPLIEGGFPGATLDLILGATKNQVIVKIPRMPSIPPGDWVVIIHLDYETFDTPVLTWVEMDKGTITFPESSGAEE
jgi:hypothetical protein